MRFRTEVVPVVLVVSAAAVTMPLVSTGCKKQDATADASTTGPIIIRRNEDIPPVMGGIAVPYVPPQPSATGSPTPPSPPANAPQGLAPAQGADGKQAAPAVADAPAQPAAIAVTHNHPADQPCNHPLKKEEVEKALSDLQSKKK